ncbi:MAG: hypothetical protein D6693_06490 [Planctomycetota bacterium]|nr:MAG: hypothetical protein D6693_06490 [Planctomycetota bacterium]
MITVRCDRCEEPLTFDDSFAGEKVECPHCGDVNRLPDPAETRPTDAPGRAPEPADAPRPDRAARAGLPPDDGPESVVAIVRPSLVRSRPLVSALLALAPLALAVTLAVTIPADKRPWAVILALPAAGWAALFMWATVVRLSSSLKVTNKRTVLREGLLSRSTSEVLHDHVRNIEVDQSFLDRCLRVGRVGISSSGQDGVEVQMARVPNPRRLREIIDLYRPL